MKIIKPFLVGEEGKRKTNKIDTLQALLKDVKPLYLPVDDGWHWEVKECVNGISCEFVGGKDTIDPDDADAVTRELSIQCFLDEVARLCEQTKYYVFKVWPRATLIVDTLPPYGVKGYRFRIGIKVKPVGPLPKYSVNEGTMRNI